MDREVLAEDDLFLRGEPSPAGSRAANEEREQFNESILAQSPSAPTAVPNIIHLGQSKGSLDEKAGLPIELRQLNNPFVLRRATLVKAVGLDFPANSRPAPVQP
jgi:hypothetical protein